MAFEFILLWVAVLIFVGVVSSKLSDRFAIPALLLFLVIGMLAGSEGIGGLYFDNAQLAKSIGVVALIFIIFSGGLDTNWKDTKPVAGPGILLSTLGVLLTAVITGFFASYILKFSFLEGMLLGSIVSSTDAAAVFSILRSKRISLKQPLKPLLEFESGSNDPMAVFLTAGFISILTLKNIGIVDLIPRFFLDMGIGALIGYLMARFIVFFINRLKLYYEGLYPVIMISLVLALIITDSALSYSESLFGKALHIKWRDLLDVAPYFLLALLVVISVNTLAPLYILSKFNITGFLSGYKGKRNSKQIWKQSLLTFQLTASWDISHNKQILKTLSSSVQLPGWLDIPEGSWLPLRHSEERPRFLPLFYDQIAQRPRFLIPVHKRPNRDSAWQSPYRTSTNLPSRSLPRLF